MLIYGCSTPCNMGVGTKSIKEKGLDKARKFVNVGIRTSLYIEWERFLSCLIVWSFNAILWEGQDHVMWRRILFVPLSVASREYIYLLWYGLKKYIYKLNYKIVCSKTWCVFSFVWTRNMRYLFIVKMSSHKWYVTQKSLLVVTTNYKLINWDSE
jgi:hypothetical protein